MTERSSIFSFFKPPESIEDREHRELLSALSEVRGDLQRARLSFDYVSEPELVEAAVYEMNACQARYNYLLRKIKEQSENRKEA